jgi:glycogen operon protein
LGSFPAGWREWNDRYRDRLRAFWRQDPQAAAGFVESLRGSPGIFPGDGSGTLNFVSCHDGFTLRDLVSYEQKHNEANGENGRDGHGHNLSRNWGAEGPSAEPAIEETRLRVQRALLASLAFSAGPPMFLQGDELSHSQGGNNNAYCQDNATTWLSWDGLRPGADLSEFVSRLLDLRRLWPRLRDWRGAVSFWDETGRPLLLDGPLEGSPAEAAPFAMLSSPRAEAGAKALAASGDGPWLLVVNPGSQRAIFQLPDTNGPWLPLLDTARFPAVPATGGGAVKLLAHSLQLYGAKSGSGPV